MAEPFPALAELIRLLGYDRVEIEILNVNYNALTGTLELRIAVLVDVPVATLDVTVVNFQFWRNHNSGCDWTWGHRSLRLPVQPAQL